MKTTFSRRAFLGRGVAGGALSFLANVPWVSAEEALVKPGAVRFSPEMEPLVRLVEDTPRERLLEEIGSRVKSGTPYRDVLAALLLAGVRNIQPRPVGFKFHAVLVVHSAHLAAQNAPDSDRWLPVFWALDQFKSSQARDVQEGDWTMPAVDEAAVPAAAAARREFTAAMDAWDVARTDAAVAGLVRTAGAQEIFDLFCRYGARDFRDIGHKAIYVANSWRTLQTIGWHHAEPVLRSLAYALLEHESTSPAERSDLADMPGRANHARVAEIRADWQRGVLSPEATQEMLATLRTAAWDDASVRVVALLNRGVDPLSVWDACFQHAGELLMRRPGIVSLHAGTTTNALRFAWQQCGNDATRRFVLLQAAAFLTLFRDRAGAGEGALIDELPAAEAAPSLEEIFAHTTSDKTLAARQTLAWMKEHQGDAGAFLQAAQRFIYLKGTDSHDYKFSSAVFEDCRHLSPQVRDRFLATSVWWLKGSGHADSPLVARTRAALG